jgi:hypothetical protein
LAWLIKPFVVYNPMDTYGVYLNESVITAGNKRANYVALVSINYTCSSITTRLNNIINVVGGIARAV